MTEPTLHQWMWPHSSSVSLPSPSYQGLPTPYTLPWHGASRTPPLWYRIRAKEEGLLEKTLPSESRKLRRKVAENLVKKGDSEESIGLNKVSGTKQERENGRELSEYQSCLRKIHDDDDTLRGTVCNLQRRTGGQWRRSLKNRYFLLTDVHQWIASERTWECWQDTMILQPGHSTMLIGTHMSLILYIYSIAK